ncbi:hypothetical protein ABW20_dc0100404 [Dactylellina cionopaga]|nr:hypothetical protein ABW20_dc0100404 [Dactylellina cionopaga]
MRRYRYDVRGGITAPPELINVPKDVKKSPGTILLTSDNKEDSTDDDEELSFLRAVGPKAKVVYHWKDDDGTYKLDIVYNEKDGFNADLSGTDERRFKIKINQTGAANNGLEKKKTENRRSLSFGKTGPGPKLNRLAERFTKSGGSGASSGAVAFLSITVERASDEDLRKQEEEEDEDNQLRKFVEEHRRA